MLEGKKYCAEENVGPEIWIEKLTACLCSVSLGSRSGNQKSAASIFEVQLGTKKQDTSWDNIDKSKKYTKL